MTTSLFYCIIGAYQGGGTIMSKAEKLLNLMMNEAVSDGEILNSRRMLIKELKSINQQLNIGGSSCHSNSYTKTYEKEYFEILKKYNTLKGTYQILLKSYEDMLYDTLNKKIEQEQRNMYIQEQILRVLAGIGVFLGFAMIVFGVFR